MKHLLRVEARGDLEIVMTREFAAPRRLVFDAWTKPELLRRWLGVWGPWTMPECEIDLRVGGSYRYVWRSTEGGEMTVRGVYREIVVPERIVNTERFDEPWYPGEALVTLALEERGGTTTSTLTIRHASRETRDAVLASPMESGVARSFDALEELVAATPAEG